MSIIFLQVLIGKTRIEGEDALRKVVVALNGLAGIAIIKQDFSQAVMLYKEALNLVEEHSDDFRLDPLLNIHIHHNLTEALPCTESSFQRQLVPGGSEKIPSGACDMDESDDHAMKRKEATGDAPSVNIISDNSSNFQSCLLGSGKTSHDVQPHISRYVQSLRLACEELKQKFLSVFTTKLSVAQQEFRKSYDQVFWFQAIPKIILKYIILWFTTV